MSIRTPVVMKDPPKSEYFLHLPVVKPDMRAGLGQYHVLLKAMSSLPHGQVML
jgi:hypothetical protein